jgi:hypothetical protein
LALSETEPHLGNNASRLFHRKGDSIAGDQVTTLEVPDLKRAAGIDLEARVRACYRSLVPSSLHGRLVSVVGQDPWHHQLHGDRDAWQNELKKLTTDLLCSPSELEREFEWLCSSEARSAFHFGQAMGEVDQNGALLDRMLSDLPLAGGAPFARGYLERFTTAHPHQLVRVNTLLDRLEKAQPRVAYDVLWSSGDEVLKVSRVLRMVEAGGLPAEFLRGLEYGVRERPLSVEELLKVRTITHVCWPRSASSERRVRRLSRSCVVSARGL